MDLAFELEMEPWELINFVTTNQIPATLKEGKVVIDFSEVCDSYYKLLCETPSTLASEEVIRMVDFYADKVETEEDVFSYYRLKDIVDILRANEPELFELASNNDFFHSLASPTYSQPANPSGMQISTSHAYLGFAPERSINYRRGIREKQRGLRQQVRDIVGKVSSFFDTDLPGKVKVSQQRKVYASIQYNNRGAGI